nr:hypothetical protein [Tanacetum cinerariifolium]
MSDESSAVTYTSVYTDSEPWRYYREDSAEIGPPRVIVYIYDGLPIQLVAPPSPDYVPGLEHPPSPDYAPLEDQPLSADASPIVASLDYVADFDLEEDSEEDPKDNQVDYTVDEGDSDDEPSDDDDDDDTDDEDPEEEPFDDEEDDEEEEYLASVDSSAVPIIDLIRLRKARKTVRPEPPMSASIEACIARNAALPSPPLLVPSLPLPLPSPLTTSPTDTGAPLGNRPSEIRMRALFPSTSRKTDIPEAEMPPQKRACLTTPAPRFGIRESSAAGAARQPGPSESDLRRYRVEQAEGVNERVTELDTTVRDIPDHRCTAILMDREAMYTREAWAYSKDKSSAIAAHVMILETQVAALITQTSSLQTQLTTTLGRIEILEARDPEPQEGPAEAGAS